MEDHPHEHPPKPPVPPHNKKLLSGLIAVAILGGGFYWYQLRPEGIRSQCAIDASKRAFIEEANKEDIKGVERIRIQNQSFETYYLLCVRSQGLAS